MMQNDSGTVSLYDTASFFKFYGFAFALFVAMNFIGMDGSFLLYGIIVSIMFLTYFFGTSGINTQFDLYKNGKKDLMVAIFGSTAFAGMVMFLLFELNQDRYYRELFYYQVGFGFTLLSLLVLFFSKDKFVLKTVEDFDGLIVQERMYDDIKIHLDDAFSYRIHKNGKKKEIYAQDIDFDVVDIFQKIRPEIYHEIKDFLFANEESRPFREYWYTTVDCSDQKNIDEYLDFLKAEIKSGDEKEKFYRYIFQLMDKKIRSVRREYDFALSLKRFQGVVEYALINMYIFASGYKNIPMGNMIAYARESKQPRHFFGVLNSLSIKSVGRYGIGFYVGYFLAIENLKDIEEEKNVMLR